MVEQHSDCTERPTGLFSLKQLISRHVTSASVFKTNRLGRLEAKGSPEVSPPTPATAAAAVWSVSGPFLQGEVSPEEGGRRVACGCGRSADGCDAEQAQIRLRGLKPSGDGPCQPNVARITASAWARGSAKRPPLQGCHRPAGHRVVLGASGAPPQTETSFPQRPPPAPGTGLEAALWGWGSGGVAPPTWQAGFPGHPRGLQLQCGSGTFRLPPPRPGPLPRTLHPANTLGVCSQLHEPGPRHTPPPTHAHTCRHGEPTTLARMHGCLAPAPRAQTPVLSPCTHTLLPAGTLGVRRGRGGEHAGPLLEIWGRLGRGCWRPGRGTSGWL